MSNLHPIVMSLNGDLRYLVPGEPGQVPSVLWRPDDTAMNWDLPRVPREAELLAHCRMQEHMLARNPHEGAARPSIGMAMNNLAALYVLEGREPNAVQALYKADSMFAEQGEVHDPRAAYLLVARATVAYNASVLARRNGDEGSASRQLDMVAMFLDAVGPEGQNVEFEFIRSAATP